MPTVSRNVLIGVGNNVGLLFISSIVNELYNIIFVIKPIITEKTAGVVITFHNILGTRYTMDCWWIGGESLLLAEDVEVLVETVELYLSFNLACSASCDNSFFCLPNSNNTKPTTFKTSNWKGANKYRYLLKCKNILSQWNISLFYSNKILLHFWSYILTILN